jgi:glutaminyl-tRNA synthetase
VRAKVRLYERLFLAQDPELEEGGDLLDQVNRDSLTEHGEAALEPSLGAAAPGERFQFERMGYFAVDTSSKPDQLVYNRTIGLRDSWAKISNQPQHDKAKPQHDKAKPQASKGTSRPGAA